MSAKRSTRASSRIAASPSVSGHCENAPASIAAPGLSLNECLGSVEIVTGMPRRVDAASRCSSFCHRAIHRPLGVSPNRLKWVMCRPTTASSVDGSPNTGCGPASPPSSPIVIIDWKQSPAFSSSVISARSRSTRVSTGSAALSQGRAAAAS